MNLDKAKSVLTIAQPILLGLLAAGAYWISTSTEARIVAHAEKSKTETITTIQLHYENRIERLETQVSQNQRILTDKLPVLVTRVEVLMDRAARPPGPTDPPPPNPKTTDTPPKPDVPKPDVPPKPMDDLEKQLDELLKRTAPKKEPN